MVIKKSQDELRLITALLRDIQTLRCEVFTARSLRLTTQKVAKRLDREGISFLTKTLPRLGKALDRALSGECILDAEACAFKSMRNSKLPIFMGELFKCVFSNDGQVLPNACTASIKQLRQICYLFFKYKLPYTAKQEQKVIAQFVKTESDIYPYDKLFNKIADELDRNIDKFASMHSVHSARFDASRSQLDERSAYDNSPRPRCNSEAYRILLRGLDRPARSIDGKFTANAPFNLRITTFLKEVTMDSRSFASVTQDALKSAIHRARQETIFDCPKPWSGLSFLSSNEDLGNSYKGRSAVITRARRLLTELFRSFDPTDIHPRHGPGAVSTKERLWSKFNWSNVPERIAAVYPIDAYFYASLGHVCDAAKEINSLGSAERPARVLLVPKDSRGPRLISCEPLENQWVQQGLGKAIVKHVELHPLTRYNVNFTNQQPNQIGALLGSSTGRYATLDLKEASDRVSVGLVRLLFPSKVLPYLLACRSLATELPNGEILTLNKYAPMGSALCFPVLALTVWAILTASAPDADTQSGILVYGDDVIVPTANAANAIEQLESFGLLVNRDKSCVRGFFRESCGMDAYKGVPVTPLRFRNVWPSRRDPHALTSWVAYANSMWDLQYKHTYGLITDRLLSLFGELPDDSMGLNVPSSLRYVSEDRKPQRTRTNANLQKREHYVWDVKAVKTMKIIDGWKMLLRYFSEGTSDTPFGGSTFDPALGQFVPDSTMAEAKVQRISVLFPAEEIARMRDRFDDGLIKVSYHDRPTAMSVSSYTKRGAVKIAKRWC